MGTLDTRVTALEDDRAHHAGKITPQRLAEIRARQRAGTLNLRELLNVELEALIRENHDISGPLTDAVLDEAIRKAKGVRND
ncbi:MAG: hypothetical protein U1E86_07630 [Burkholderiaceae bacterium]